MANTETTAPHPREITLERIFQQKQRILDELGQIREQQDELALLLERIERRLLIDAPPTGAA